MLILNPGDLDQIAIAEFISKETKQGFIICKTKNSNKIGEGGAHKKLLNKYGHCLSKECVIDCSLSEVMMEGAIVNDAADLLIIGPPKISGKYVDKNRKLPDSLTMQGGFLDYNNNPYLSPSNYLDKMMGKHTMPTFNMNGAPKETLALVSSGIKQKRFVGKNVCHTIVFNKEHLSRMSKPKCRASELFIKMAKIYLGEHDEKKFHDPLAAVLHLHPEIGKWVNGSPYGTNGEWGTILNEASVNFVLGDVDRDKFWNYIYNWK